MDFVPLGIRGWVQLCSLWEERRDWDEVTPQRAAAALAVPAGLCHIAAAPGSALPSPAHSSHEEATGTSRCQTNVSPSGPGTLAVLCSPAVLFKAWFFHCPTVPILLCNLKCLSVQPRVPELYKPDWQ